MVVIVEVEVSGCGFNLGSDWWGGHGSSLFNHGSVGKMGFQPWVLGKKKKKAMEIWTWVFVEFFGFFFFFCVCFPRKFLGLGLLEISWFTKFMGLICCGIRC